MEGQGEVLQHRFTLKPPDTQSILGSSLTLEASLAAVVLSLAVFSTCKRHTREMSSRWFADFFFILRVALCGTFALYIPTLVPTTPMNDCTVGA